MQEAVIESHMVVKTVREHLKQGVFSHGAPKVAARKSGITPSDSSDNMDFTLTPRAALDLTPRGGIEQTLTRATESGITLTDMAEDIWRVSCKLLEVIAAAQQHGSATEGCSPAATGLLDVSIRIAQDCQYAGEATAAGAALSRSIEVGLLLQMDVQPALDEMKDTYLRLISPQYTPEGFGKNQLTHTNNLLQLPRLDSEALRSTLYTRYKKGVPYTYAGNVVVSVNPCRDMGNLSDEILRAYRDLDCKTLPPHVFALADSVLSAVIASGKKRGFWDAPEDQGKHRDHAIIISGESGAGKTEAAKLCLRCVTESSGATNAKSFITAISQSTPIMEAMGNAATTMNSNSSRFGKLLDVHLSREGQITGAEFTVYLLEKTRVTSHGVGERNYHSLYLLCSAPLEVRRKLKLLSGPESFRCLKHSGTAKTDQTPITWKAFDGSFADVGVSEEQKFELWRILALVLLMSRLSFQEDSAVGSEGAKLVHDEIFKSCKELLEVDDASLDSALTERTAGGGAIGTYTKSLTVKQAQVARDSMCMLLYQIAFDWCVSLLNEKTKPRANSVFASIRILDIFGFENLKTNAFPQLCINLANESLQRLFIDHIYEMEAEEHAIEGIEMQPTTFGSASDMVIDLVSGKTGIYEVLDESTGIDRADKQMLQEFHSRFADRPAYRKPLRGSDEYFGINHYAGQVVYNVNGFVEMNKDEISDTIMSLLESKSSFKRLKSLATSHFQKQGNRGKETDKRKRVTIASQFGASMQTLMHKLRNSDAHFVRCIKPNSLLIPGEWDSSLVTRQLAYSGLLELAQMRKQSLSERRNLRGFCGFFSACCRDVEAVRAQPLHLQAEQILDELGVSPDDYKIGKNRIFLTPSALEACEIAHASVSNHLMQAVRAVFWLRFGLKVWLAKHREKNMRLSGVKEGGTLLSGFTAIIPVISDDPSQPASKGVDLPAQPQAGLGSRAALSKQELEQQLKQTEHALRLLEKEMQQADVDLQASEKLPKGRFPEPEAVPVPLTEEQKMALEMGAVDVGVVHLKSLQKMKSAFNYISFKDARALRQQNNVLKRLLLELKNDRDKLKHDLHVTRQEVQLLSVQRDNLLFRIKRLEGALSKAMEATRSTLIAKRARKQVPEGVPPLQLSGSPAAFSGAIPQSSSPTSGSNANKNPPVIRQREESIPDSPGLVAPVAKDKAAVKPPAGLPPGMPPGF